MFLAQNPTVEKIVSSLLLINSSKVDFTLFCHSVFETESRDFNVLQASWTPVFIGVTTFDECIFVDGCISALDAPIDGNKDCLIER